MKEIGIYGGTFAPIHNGHIHAVRSLLAHCPLDLLFLIPTRKPPHKVIDASDDPEARLAMLKLAFPENEPENGRIRVSDFELRSDKPSYTALTLQHFSAPDTHLTFFCGTDMFLSMDNWYEPQTIFTLADITHIPRQHQTAEESAQIARKTEEYETRFGARIRHLSITPYPLSSTEVRAAIAAGKPLDGMLPSAVCAYITAHGLYREGTP